MCMYVYVHIYIWRIIGQSLGAAAISKETVKAKVVYLDGLSFKQN
jgi:hypothetical protein